MTFSASLCVAFSLSIVYPVFLGCVCVWTNELLLQSQLNFSWAKLFPYHVSESYCNATPFTIGKVSWVCLQSKCCEFYIRASTATQHTVCTPLLTFQLQRNVGQKVEERTRATKRKKKQVNSSRTTRAHQSFLPLDFSAMSVRRTRSTTVSIWKMRRSSNTGRPNTQLTSTTSRWRWQPKMERTHTPTHETKVEHLKGTI